jgi:hypothetical protein
VSRPRISEAQANAEALARRSAQYAPEHAASVSVQWDYRHREPTDLRDAVRLARKAYADEVPERLHEGPDSIGEGGTPRMDARAMGYLFGNAQASYAPKASCTCGGTGPLATEMRALDDAGAITWDAPLPHGAACPKNPANQEALSYYHAPFRATLSRMASSNSDAQRKRAAIVSHVTIGSQGPQEAAISEGVPEWCAKLVAMDALRSFLRILSDVKVHTATIKPQDGITAA